MRLDSLTLDELTLIDDHPLVRACMRATSLVARAYLSEMQAGSGGACSALHSGPSRGPGRRGPPLERSSSGSAQPDVHSGPGLLGAHHATAGSADRGGRAAAGAAPTEQALHGERATAGSMTDAKMTDATSDGPACAASAAHGSGPGLSEAPSAVQQRSGGLPTEMLASPQRRAAVQPVQAAAPCERSSQRSASAGVRRRLQLK